MTDHTELLAELKEYDILLTRDAVIAIRELEKSLDFLNDLYKDICHANRDNCTEVTKLQAQVKEYDNALAKLSWNFYQTNLKTSSESWKYAESERKRIKATGVKE